jgi:hypothetical protein
MSEGSGVNAVTVLVELARHVRQCTLQLLTVPDEAWLAWAPPGTSNHLLWHAGHAVWLQDLLTVEPLTGRSELPAGWAAKFGQDSRPATVSEWPGVAEVRALLEAQLDRIVMLMAANDELIVREANRRSKQNGWPLLPGMIHGWHDEARHQGEMYLLHKLLRASVAR